MATKLIKDVTRETLAIKSRKGRPVIVTLAGGDLLQFREKGKRKTFEVSLGHCFNLAFIMQHEQDYKQKLERYNEQKKYRSKLKKPKRSALPFNGIYFKVINN